MERLLFVYGTLRRASPHPMARYLGERAEFRGLGSVAGKVHDLGRYPGLLPSSTDRVPGEVFELRDPIKTLPRLDEYEGCSSSPPLYERRLTDIAMDDGSTCVAWVYWYLGEVPV